MTVTTNISKKSFATNGSTTLFELGAGFIFFDASELVVTFQDSDGVETLQVITTDYTVSGGAGTTGSVTMNSAPADEGTLLIQRVMPLTQAVDLVNNSTSDAEVIEDSLDKLTLGLQQLDESVGRVVRASPFEDDIDPLPTPTARRGKLLRFVDDADAQPEAVSAADLSLITLSSVGKTLVEQTTKLAMRNTGLGINEVIPGRNFIDNPNFSVAQRGISFTSATAPANSDDTYLFDRWVLLSDGNDIFDVSLNTTAADIYEGCYSGVNLDVETEDKKGGLLQILSARNTATLFKQGNGKVSLSFYASTSDPTNYVKIRAAVVAWSSTADAPTSDIISAWGGEGENPTLISNWTFENTPAALADLTATVQRFEIEDIACDTASTANLGVFIWMDDMTNDAGDIVTISGAKLEPGEVCTNYIDPNYEEELNKALYYFWRQTRNGTGDAIASGHSVSTTISANTLRFPRPMRIAPAFSVSDVSHFTVYVEGAAVDTTGLTATAANANSIVLNATTGASQTAGQGVELLFDATSGAFIQFSAEL